MKVSTARVIADVLRVSLLVGAVITIASDSLQSGWGMLLVFAITVVIRLARATPAVELTSVLALSLDAWLTSTGVLGSFSREDHTGHLLIAASICPVVIQCIRASRREAAQLSRFALAAAASAITLGLGIVWEFGEWLSDIVVDTQMSLGWSDTVGDLAADAIGAVVGAAIVFLLAVLPSSRGTRLEGESAVG